ncbi:hypothetical protein GQ54DRAFT_206 [Martensiomyces pterosporus]|nr:hypothetical protein GQ54DRAFT_206 [Martensiomyces pterosporus]
MQLSKAEHYEARKTLACSLHEVARIMASSSMQDAQGLSGESPGPSFSADLESVLCLFLIDGAEIKMGALAHLGDTLTWLTPTSRVRCLPMIMQVFKHDGKQWRTRELMATQLVKLCHLFPASVVVGSLLPQAVDWAHDPVAGVRAAVAPAFPIMFELTKLDPTTQVRFFETVISFSHADTFRGRLFFVEICSALLAHDQDPDADPVDFDQFFLPSLAALATDRVANVRIALARLVRRMLENRMRRQSISATLADMWISSTPADGSLSPSAAAGAAHLDSVHTSTSPGGQHVRVGDLEDRADEWVDESSDGHNNGTSWSPSSPTTRHRRSSGANGGNRNSAPPGTRASAGGRGIQKRLSRKAAPLSRHRSLSRGSGDGSISPRLSANSAAKFYSHRSFGSVASMRRRRNTTPMRAHLLATMVQQLAKDTDRDVLDLVRDLPGLPIVSADSPRTPTVGTIEEHSPSANSFEAATAAEGAGEADGDSGSGRRGSQLMAFPRPPPSPPLAPQELPPSSPPPPSSQEMGELNLDDVPGSPGVPAASAFSANVPEPHVDGGGNEVGSAAEDHTLGISAISHPPEVNAATPATAATANNVAAASLTIPSKGEHLQALDSDGLSKPALKFPELKRPDQAKIHNETSASVPL